MYIAISNSIDTYNLIKIIPFNTPLFSNTYVAFFTFSQYDLFSVLHQLKSTNIQCNLYQNFALWVTTGCRSPSKEVCVCMVGWWCLNYILY